MTAYLASVFALHVFYSLQSATGHGAVIALNRGSENGRTGSRNVQTNKGLHPGFVEWDEYSMNGIGGRVDEFDVACGELGQAQRSTYQYTGIATDPAGKSWDVADVMSPGDDITFRTKVTANHGGIMEFRYVCTDGLTKDTLELLDFYDPAPSLATLVQCFDDNADSNIWRESSGCWRPRRLVRAATSGNSFHPERPEWYIFSQDPQCFDASDLVSGTASTLDMTYKLPSSLGTCSRVVIQWWWQTTNGCLPAIWKTWHAQGTFPCSSGSFPNWNSFASDENTCDASAGTKARSGEQFVNCIDVALATGATAAPATGTATETVTETTTASTPTTGEQFTMQTTSPEPEPESEPEAEPGSEGESGAEPEPEPESAQGECDSRCVNLKTVAECEKANTEWNMCAVGGIWWAAQCRRTCKACDSGLPPCPDGVIVATVTVTQTTSVSTTATAAQSTMQTTTPEPEPESEPEAEPEPGAEPEAEPSSAPEPASAHGKCDFHCADVKTAAACEQANTVWKMCTAGDNWWVAQCRRTCKACVSGLPPCAVGVSLVGVKQVKKHNFLAAQAAALIQTATVQGHTGIDSQVTERSPEEL